MNILITGGTGFIGKQIARKILELGTITLDGQAAESVEKIILFDAVAGENTREDPKIQVVIGDITDKERLVEISKNVDVIWHLAAVVSSAAEADFDLGME